jgi:hypothetical protein
LGVFFGQKTGPHREMIEKIAKNLKNNPSNKKKSDALVGRVRTFHILQTSE